MRTKQCVKMKIPVTAPRGGHLALIWAFVLFSSLSSGVINGQSESPLTIDVNENENVLLECRFSPQLSKKASTLYWIRTNRKGHDNVAIGATPFQANYIVDHRPEEGLYDLRINKANYDRDNGQFECRMKEGGTGMELHSKSVELTVLLNPSPPKISPSDPTATEGRPLNLTCASIGGSPPPQIYWYTEGQSQPLEANLIVGKNKDEPTQSVLTMIPTKEDDGNSYRCTVWNRALGQRQKLETSTKIYVNYFARVSVGPENPLQVEKDDTAQLECRVDAKPTVNTVKWTRNGRFIDTHFKHTIPRVTLQDSGSYVCSADNGLGQVGKSELKLDVLYGPIVTLQPAAREFNENDNIEVDCRVDANPRPSTIQWFKEGDERFVQNGPTLRLNGVTAQNNGRYICSATNHLQPTGKGKLTRSGNATIDVNIRHKPGKGVITPETPKAIDGRRITLTCGADPPGYPTPQFKWWQEGSESTTLAVGSEFTIDSARLNNAGKYLCQPSNELGKGTVASVDLEVNQAPKIITQLQSTIMKRAGDTGFHITCSAIGKPKPKVRWFKDGQEIMDSESNLYQIATAEQETISNMAFNVLSTLKYVGPDRISAKQLMPTDRGQYTCRFENEVDKTETTMLLRIEHSPVVVHQHNKVAFDVEETAIINCKMQAFPSPRFDWSFGNSILQSDRQFYDTNITALGNDIYQGVLRINKVTDNSYGEYICKGINTMGAKRTIIKLQPKGKPDRPINIRPINVGFNFITIGWDPGFDGGFNDTTHSLEFRRHDSSTPGYDDCSTRDMCNITGLEQHSQYYIKVKASNIKGESKYSDEISVVTKVDVAKIPTPENVHFEKTTNTASFNVVNDYLPLVAKVELENSDGTWVHYDQLSMTPGSSALGEMPITAEIVNNLRVRLCLETNEVLCGPYSGAKFVDVRPSISTAGQPWLIGIVIFIVVFGIMAVIITIKCCCYRSKSNTKDVRERPSIVHTTHQPPPYHHGIENKGVDTLKDADEMIKNNFGGTFVEQQTQSASNSNSANSVNSQDSLWNVKGAPHHPHDPNMMHHNAYQMQTQGYSVYDAMAMQQQQQQLQQQQQHQQQQQQLQQQQQYPEDYTHYPHPEEYLNERNQQFIQNEFYRQQQVGGGGQRLSTDSDYSPYGDVSSLPHPYHQQQMQMGGEFEEPPQTPTHNPHGQMSFDDAIDGGSHNNGSYNVAGQQQQRRIIREIIV